MYGVLHYIAAQRAAGPAGWVHLPHLPEVAALERNLGAPSMSVETAAAGLRVAIRVVVDHPRDIADRIASRLQA